MSKNYVKEYKGYKVPEGATHYNDDFKAFYKTTPSEGRVYFSAKENDWLWVTGSAIGLKESIEIPEEPAQEWVDGLPTLNSEVFLSDEDGHLFSSASNEKVSIAEDEVLVVVSIGARYDNGNPVVTLMAKDSKNLQGFVTVNPKFLEPVKTQEQKDREAFIEKAKGIIEADDYSHRNLTMVMSAIEKMFDSGFKAPEGE